MTEIMKLGYGVGALLYCPANQTGIIRVVTEGRIEPPYSAALCLEDAIADTAVEEAEQQAVQTVKALAACSGYRPKVFLRVRSAAQIGKLSAMLAAEGASVTGYILPKYTAANADAYHQAILEANKQGKVWMMPILESPEFLRPSGRAQALAEIREKIDSMRPYVLNVRIGGNDFCNYYGLRRQADQTIYDIGILRSAISDIAGTFMDDYVVSAPVWEYFDTGTDDRWRTGLRRELTLDRLNGLVGKTAIHPSQVAEINRSLRVSAEDYRDAQQVLHWNRAASGVAKRTDGSRMNEVKTHQTWAQKMLCLAELYGVEQEGAV